jgi:hypothetical protein
MNYQPIEGVFQWYGNQVTLVPFISSKPIYGVFTPRHYGTNTIQLNIIPVVQEFSQFKKCTQCALDALYRDLNREVKYCSVHAIPGSYSGRAQCEVIKCNKIPIYGKKDKNQILYSSRCIDHKQIGDLSSEILKCVRCNVTYCITCGVCHE